ncbi:unnamed protein product [Prorocentrum cordatum]|uniref:Uncharacterized protein n=1 Tax=Prorocentrum cordatum TaxID=2364126 RepID=A0ABN9Q5P8_9DINO|nr:unnamed protein product [Polarella glacialis]
MAEAEAEGAPADAGLGLGSLAQRFEKDGIDTAFLEEPFLEESELGDGESLRARLVTLSPDDRRKFLKTVDQHGRTGLIIAARRGDADLTAVLLDAGANPNECDASGSTALHYAGGRGSAAVVEALLNARADIEKKDDQGETPLLWAGSVRALGLLLRAGADAHARGCRGRTALMLASARGDADSVELLAQQAGTDLDLCDDSGTSAHATAVTAGHSAVADLLVRLGAAATPQLAPRIAAREDALHEAARSGDAGACRSFLAGGDVAVDHEVAGETALLLAAGCGSAAAVEVLLQHRADPNRADGFLQETPLMRAVLGGCAQEVLWLLLEARADPSLGDLSGRTPLDAAVAWKSHAGAKILQAAAAGQLDFSNLD